MTGHTEGQHRWEETFAQDEQGRPVPPRHHRIILAHLAQAPSPALREALTAAFDDLDARFEHGPSGVLSTVGWGAAWFNAHSRVPGVIGPAVRMSRWEDPVIEDHDVFIHLASDDPANLDAAQDLLLAAGGHDLGRWLTLAPIRTGFVGAGLPSRHLDRLGIPESSPLLFGFRSILKKNQATEDDITIEDGPLAGGTTAHLSRIVLDVEKWHAKSRDEQAALLFVPTVTARQADEFVEDAPSDYDRFAETVREHGIVGHAQAAARARINNTPIINRRDFATVDDDRPGTHFISLQRELRDFNNTRAVMNGADGVDHSDRVGQRYRNGINAFFTVTHRSTFMIPPRSLRVLPLAAFEQDAVGVGPGAR